VSTAAPTTTRVRLPVLTNSEVRTFRRCARERHLSYGLGYRSASTPDVVRFGNLIHLGMEAWWLADDGLRLDAALRVMSEHSDDEFELARARMLMTGYDSRYRDEPYAVLAVECEFSVPLVNPETGAPSRTYELAGKIDVIVRDLRDGLVYLVEHKTTSLDHSAGTDYWKILHVDSQISTYYAGAKALGYDVAGCVYDVLTRPAQRPLKATPVDARKFTKQGRLYANQRDTDETVEQFELRLLEAIATEPDHYYHRGTVVRLQAEEREAAFDVWQMARLIREADLAGRHPRNVDSCIRYSRACVFLPVCTGTASLDDTTLYRRAERTHEELSPKIEAA